MLVIRFLTRFCAVFIAASLLTLSGALAHAGLVSTDPADGSVLPTAPNEITFTFTEPATPLVFTLVSADGERHALNGVAAANERIVVSLPAGLSRGTHLVSWRIASADGHPVGGSLVFSVGEAGATPQLSPGDQLRADAIWLVRSALYVALLLGVGMVAFGLVVAPLPHPLLILTRGLAGAGLILSPLALGLQGLDALDTGFADLLSAAPWSAALATSYAATIAAMVVAFVATLLATGARGVIRVTLILLAWIAAALAPMLSGHAGTANPEWLSRPAVLLHIASLIFWVGALLPLSWLLRAGDPPALSALRRFSTLIPFAVLPLVVSGVALAVLQMGAPGPEWFSSYGLLLGAKLALLAVLFGLALWNRLALTHPALAGAEPARRHLRRSVVVELLLVVALFGVVAGWRFTPPPRVLAEIAATPAEAHLHSDTAMAMVTITPGRAGAGKLSIWLGDIDGEPMALKTLGVALSNPALGVERLQRQAMPDPTFADGEGYWQTPLVLPAGGTWTVELDLRISDFKLEKLTGEIELAP